MGFNFSLNGTNQMLQMLHQIPLKEILIVVYDGLFGWVLPPVDINNVQRAVSTLYVHFQYLMQSHNHPISTPYLAAMIG